MDQQLQKNLKKIETEIAHIRRQSDGGWKRTVWNGILYGAGWVAGTIIAALLIGWLLSILGVIPGFGDMVQSLQNVIEKQSRF
ncbi:MAG TPA: hypothetical protein VJH91_01930 [Candidatus Paceibacterota bacterium]|uniref:Uncharacterized protein n=1 Tax=Candidatus Ryanbacteria bacterium RIFCSPHIGHO2_01_FULL_48_27 TaxID=1802115 RepID=A0A1G2G2S9_9BACT|nr:MAG: hypothetical protein A2756_03215 [Candidatus Ryanbacteria bacterium RIFCSPHIGHO2_01_FULL_48_27]